MNAELAIHKILSADSTFNAHVGGSEAAAKIYYDIAPQTAKLPYTILREISVDPNDTKDGRSDFDFGYVEVQHYAADRLKASNMARDARQALDRANAGTYNTIVVVSIAFETQNSDAEEIENNIQHVKEQTYKVITR